MIFALAGGIAWFFQAAIPALVLWGVAIIIIFKSKQKTNKSNASNHHNWLIISSF
jgi:hypothetical protein